MSGTYTKESSSHQSRETESSHKPARQQKSSRTESRKVVAPQKPSSTAKAPVTSAAAVDSTNVAASKRTMPVDVSKLQLNSVHVRLAKVKEQQDTLDAKNAKAAAKKKENAEAERRKADEERKKKLARDRYHWDPRFDRSYLNEEDSVSDGTAIEPKRNSAAKERTAKDKEQKKTEGKEEMLGKKRSKKSKASSTSNVSTSPKKGNPTTTQQLELSNAESNSVSTEAASASHDASSSLVPASAPGDVLGRFEYAMRQEIYAGFDKLSDSQTVDVMNVIMEYATMGNRQLKLDNDNALGVDDIARCDLIKVVVRIRGHLENDAIQNVQVHPAQSEKSKPLASADGVKRHGKRSLHNDDDDQVTSEDSDAHRRKKVRGSGSLSSPREKSASATPSSTQNLVTVHSAAVKAVPAVPWGMIPFGADGHAAQKYHDFQEQLFNQELAKFEARESAKQVQKRSASEELPEPMAKKFKPSEKEKALAGETQQASGQPMAQAKAFKEEDAIEKPEVASPAGDESIPSIDIANAVLHSHGTATGENASATETEPATKEEAESNNDEDNKSSSSSAEDSSNDEKKVTEQTSKTGTASANTSAPKNDHQDATQCDNKTSQTSDEKPAEPSSDQTAKSTHKTQDGQTSVTTTASTTTSGSATETTTQQTTAQRSQKEIAQDQVANVSKKPTNDSNDIDTDDEARSATENPAKKKPATKPQRKAKASEDQHSTTNKQSSVVIKKSAAKKSTSKGSAVKQPSASTQQPPQPRVTGAARFIPTTKEDRERAAAQNVPVMNKQPLADKTNTSRQSTKLGTKKAPAPRTKEQPKAAEKQSAQVKSAASQKRKHGGDDAVESNLKPAEKKQRKEQSKKRSRVEDEDDDTGSTNKKTKKQRTNLPSTTTSTQPEPDTSTSFHPDRESRSRAAAKKRAANATHPQAPRPQNSALWVDFDNEALFQPQSQARAQASATVNEDEQTEETGQTAGDDEQHGVKDKISGNTGDAEDAPASNSDKPQPQKKEKKKKKKNGFIAHRRGEDPEDPEERRKKKQQQAKKLAASEEAQHKKEVDKLFAKHAR